MATTGFWPVRGRLKEVIDYANNPDKTTAKEYLDEDPYAAICYVENDDKTDQTMFVSGINCSKHNAYNEMIAVKRHFGERGKNIAYHGYQSFAAGEVTPDEAHAIGIETARQMWGARYQVVVTTHLNTDNIHNHFVINSVSFVDGKSSVTVSGISWSFAKSLMPSVPKETNPLFKVINFTAIKRNIGYATPAGSPIGICCGGMWMKHFPNAVPLRIWNITLNALATALTVTSVTNTHL